MQDSDDPSIGMALTANDLAALDKSYITPDQAKQARIFRVNSREGATLVGRNGRGDYSGIIFPYYWPGESKPREYRLRPTIQILKHSQTASLRRRKQNI